MTQRAPHRVENGPNHTAYAADTPAAPMPGAQPGRRQGLGVRVACLGAALVTLTGLVACSLEDSATPAEDSAANTAAEQPSADQPGAEQPAAETGDAAGAEAMPIDVLPITAGREDFTECPYLGTEFVADTNGQRVTGQSIDTRFDPPACVFWSYPEEPQLTVMVRHMNTPGEAKAVVDWAAPIDATSPANEPAGWDGGRGTLGPESSVYAVFRDTTAVVVFSNQEQSIKPQLVAEETIRNLGL